MSQPENGEAAITSVQKIKHIVAGADDKKAREVVTLAVGARAAFCEYFVIATGTSPTHIRAITDGVRDVLKSKDVRPHHIEGYQDASWVVMDYGSVVVHIFTEEARLFYNLERLWADVPRDVHASTVGENTFVGQNHGSVTDSGGEGR